MWRQATDVGNKWIDVNDAGRIIARIVAKDGEYKTTTLIFDEDGVGSSEGLGAYATLVAAQEAVAARGHVPRP